MLCCTSSKVFPRGFVPQGFDDTVQIKIFPAARGLVMREKIQDFGSVGWDRTRHRRVPVRCKEPPFAPSQCARLGLDDLTRYQIKIDDKSNTLTYRDRATCVCVLPPFPPSPLPAYRPVKSFR